MSNSIAQFLTPANLRQAWKHVASNQGCSGVDGETIAQFAQYQPDNLSHLRKSLLTGIYQPLPLRQLFIPKKDGSWRSLGIPTVRDRIVQQALLQVLHPVMEAQFEPVSFAYRPGRSHLMAVRQIAHWRDRGYDWVLDGDIIQYFDNVQHPRLLAEVAERLTQPQFLDLIEDWLKVGVLTKQGLIFPQKGLPQGAVISPLLANIYLDDFDEILADTNLKLVRYADDFVLLGRSQKQVTEAHTEVAQILSEMGLQLHPDKTQITNFDKGFRFLGQAFTKDLIVPVSKPLEPEPKATFDNDLRLVHSETITQPTALQLAMIDALKASNQPIPPPLFVVFGYTIRPEKPVPIDSKEDIWITDMATIYLVDQGTTLRKEQGRFLVQPLKEPEQEIPIREVEKILVFGNIQLTSTVISTCLEEQIPVVFLTQLGEYKGHLWSAESKDLVVEIAQFERRQDEGFRLAVAREIVRGKLWNSKQLLLRLNRKRQLPEVAETIAQIHQDMESLDSETVTTIDQIRGYEGIGAARYFPALGKLIVNPGFTLTERTRRPPKDPINSLLSFGYSLLYDNVFSLLLAEGINPYLGHLHGAEEQKAYLAFDLMEEFRSPIVDTLVMKLVNQKILKPTDFKWPSDEGGIYLTDAARKVFLHHFEEQITMKLSHPDIKEKVSYRRVIHLQIQRYRRFALNDNLPYEPFLRTI